MMSLVDLFWGFVVFMLILLVVAYATRMRHKRRVDPDATQGEISSEKGD